MKKIYLIYAAAISVALTNCTNDEIVGGENHGTQQSITDAISFGGNAGKLTRATSNTGTVAEMLDNKFKVYGVKKGDGSNYANVFKNYIVWSSNTQSPTNPQGANGWEYAGTVPSGILDQVTRQYAKYWDYSSDNYHFVAGSPVNCFSYTLDANGDIASASVNGLGGHITANPGTSGTTTFNPVYIADPVRVPKADYKNEITFSFKRQQTFVRVGVYETIPGYKITKIQFYPYKADEKAWDTTPSDNIVLAVNTSAADGTYFQGASGASATITYDWTGVTPTYTYAYSSTGLSKSKNWYGGKLNETGWEMATTSTETSVAKLYGSDKDMASATGYFTVMPTEGTTAQPILIKCDYELTSEDNEEVIKVKGATAAIPSAFTFWKANTTYTYLFKISPNTNGTTGTPGTTDAEGLFPITFNAVVTASADGMIEGNTTTVSTPSITTYQDGSVTDEGITYKYNSSDPKPIYFTAQNDETGAPYTLTTGGSAVSNVQVYKLSAEQTEADLIVAAPTTTVTTTIVSAATTVGSWTIPAGSASFTPDAAGYYAIQYQTATSPAAAYTYKVIHVE